VRNPIKRSGSEKFIFSLLFEERFSASLLFVYHGARPYDEFLPVSGDSLLPEPRDQLEEVWDHLAGPANAVQLRMVEVEEQMQVQAEEVHV
jgi:hypothetical protein